MKKSYLFLSTLLLFLVSQTESALSQIDRRTTFDLYVESPVRTYINFMERNNHYIDTNEILYIVYINDIYDERDGVRADLQITTTHSVIKEIGCIEHIIKYTTRINNRKVLICYNPKVSDEVINYFSFLDRDEKLIAELVKGKQIRGYKFILEMFFYQDDTRIEIDYRSYHISAKISRRYRKRRIDNFFNSDCMLSWQKITGFYPTKKKQ